jgi:hypothetical protein
VVKRDLDGERHNHHFERAEHPLSSWSAHRDRR